MNAAEGAGGDARTRLFRLVREKCFSRDEEIQLASGRSSNFYFNMKHILFDPEAIDATAELILAALQDEPVDFVGGLEMGAVPLVTAVSLKSHGTREIPGFFVRKAAKDHGTRNLIEGVRPDALDGKVAVLLDDVTTTAGSVLQAVRAARAAGATVDTVVTVVDRLEGAEENLAAEGVKLVAIYLASEF